MRKFTAEIEVFIKNEVVDLIDMEVDIKYHLENSGLIHRAKVILLEEEATDE